MRQYKQVTRTLYGTVWFMTEESLNVMLEIMELKLDGVRFTPEEINTRIMAARENSREHLTKMGVIDVVDGIGVINLHGSIMPKADLMSQLSGGASLDSFNAGLKALASDKSVQQIIMNVDSPGGSGTGLIDSGKLIRRVAETKPVIASVDYEANSAAYWLASQASKIYAPADGMVGSVGAFTIHRDMSAAAEKAGIKHTIIKAGPHKVENSPLEPLSAEAHAYAQEQIDKAYGNFVAAIASGRNTTTEDVIANYGGGRVLRGDDALAVGMIDGIKTFDELMGGLTTGSLSLTGDAVGVSLAVPRALAITMGEQDLGRAEPTETPKPDQRVSIADKKTQGVNGESPKVEPEETTVSTLAERLRTVLGTEDDVDEDGLLSIIQTKVTDASAVANATATVQAARSFAEQFPQEYTRMQALEKTNREAAASEFAKSYLDARIEKDGQPTDKGFSALTAEKIREAYLSAVDGGCDVTQLTAILDSIKSGGLVAHGEVGNARAVDVPANRLEAAGAFTTKMQELMASDKIDARTATTLAAEQHPELWAAYREKAGRS